MSHNRIRLLERNRVTLQSSLTELEAALVDPKFALYLDRCRQDIVEVKRLLKIVDVELGKLRGKQKRE